MRSTSHRLVFAVAAGCLVVAACGGQSAADALDAAKASLSKSDAKSAVLNLKTALQAEPNSAEARFLLGKILLERGDAEPAAIEFRKAVALKYPPAQVVPQLARAMLEREQFRALVDEFAGVELGQPAATADLQTSLATAYDSLGNANKAQAAIRVALKAVPDNPATLLLQARMLGAAGKFDEATALVYKVITASPADAEAWYDKGVILFRGKSDTPGAIAALSKAVALQPKHTRARSDLITLLLESKDLPAAKVQLEALRKISPNSIQVRFFDAQIALIDHKPKVALELIDPVLKAAPDKPKVLQLAGAIQLENGMLQSAERSLSRALDLAPELSAARQLLAQAFLYMGQPEKALNVLQPLLAQTGANPGASALAGAAHLRTGDLDLSRADYSSALKLDPTNPGTRTVLALTNSQSAGIDATARELRSIAASDKGTIADVALVSLLAEAKRFPQALAAAEATERKLPKSPAGAELKGQVYIMSKDLVASRKSFERALEIDPKYFPATSMLAALDLIDGKPEAAKKRFETVLAADPSNYQATMQLATMLPVIKAPADEIKRLLEKAIKLQPAEVQPRLLLIRLYLDQKDSRAAVNAAKEAVAAQPDSPDLLEALGSSQVVNGSIDEAITTFGKLTLLKPHSPEPHLRVAAAFVMAKNDSAAEKSLQQALSLQPDLLAAQQTLIQLMVRSNRQDQALLIAKTVQKQRPDSEAGFMMEGSIESSRKNYAAAADIYRKVLDKMPNTDLAILTHATLMSAQQGAAADKMASTWTAQHPKDARFIFHLGDVAMARAEYGIAEKYFRDVLAIEPENVAAINNIAWILAKSGKPDAVSYAEKAVKLQPNIPGLMDTLAMALAADKQTGKALEVQKQALALAPADPDLRLSLAKLYLQSGDKAEARTELEALAKLKDKFHAGEEVSRLLKSL